MDIFLDFCTSDKQRLCLCSEYLFKNVCFANIVGEEDSVCVGGGRPGIITDSKERRSLSLKQRTGMLNIHCKTF